MKNKVKIEIAGFIFFSFISTLLFKKVSSGKIKEHHPVDDVPYISSDLTNYNLQDFHPAIHLPHHVPGYGR